VIATRAAALRSVHSGFTRSGSRLHVEENTQGGSPMRTFFALAAPALAGAFLMATPSAAAPLSFATPDAAPLTTQVQWGGGYGGGYGERREEYRDDRRFRERREYRDDGDDWRRRRERRRMFCRMHPDVCD
jgi:hypothetical protein